MTDTSITRARRRSARLAAKRIPRVSATESQPSEHVLQAREDFAYFCTAMGKPPAPHMLEWHKELLTGESNDVLMDVAGRNTCLLSPRGPLDLETPVLTPSGWKRLWEVRVGQSVYDSYGRPTRVTDVMRYGDADCWDVELSDGTVVTCDDSHGWVVRNSARGDSPWKKTTLRDLRTTLRTRARNDKGQMAWVIREAEEGEKPWLTPRGAARYIVPVCDPVVQEERKVPLDPYVLGVFLARGSLTGSAVRITLDDEEVIERLAASLPPGCRVRRVAGATVVWSISGDGSKPEGVRWVLSRNPILPILEELGLWGVPTWARPFPEAYLRGSIAQRVALLQGFSDACGSVLQGGKVGYYVRSSAVAEGMLELMRSLGGLASSRRIARPGRRDTIRLDAAFPDAIMPFHSDKEGSVYRKRLQVARPGRLNRTIVDIRPAGKRSIGCITVESKLHDFLVSGHAVSCNSAKSTEIGLLASWLIGRHTLAKRLLRILYVSFIVDVSRNKSKGIKNTLESPEYQEIFPCVRLSKDRTADELWSIDFKYAGIDIRGEDAFTVACAGLKGAIVSKRSNLVILDDLIKSAEAIKNPETRREMENNWSAVIEPTMFDGARAIALGTRYHFDDILATTFTEEKGWIVKIQAAIHYDDDGRAVSYWPDMWPVEGLLEKRDRNPVNFAYQYMNTAVRTTDLGVGPELLIKGTVPDSFDEIGVGVDLSAGLKERNDYTVFMLGGRDGDKAYIIDQRRIRAMGNIEKIEALCDLLHEWNLLGRDESGRYLPTRSEVAIWPESVAYQKSFQGDLRRILFDEWGLTNVRVSPVMGVRGDKLARFRGVIGLFETGRVVFNKYRNFQVTHDEVLNMGHAPHDDCVDALQILLSQLFRRGPVEIGWPEAPDMEFYA